ncbi:molybdopterin molybdenumtransferase MoeA, partial [Streptomyces canus]
MTARSVRTDDPAGPDADADDLDVEEALALVREDNGTAPPGGQRPPAPPPQGSGPAARPDAHHRATPWPE